MNHGRYYLLFQTYRGLTKTYVYILCLSKYNDLKTYFKFVYKSLSKLLLIFSECPGNGCRMRVLILFAYCDPYRFK